MSQQVDDIFSGSVVLYNHPIAEIAPLVKDFLKANETSILFLVDNSPNTKLAELSTISPRIIYHSFPHNPGFGFAHNWALSQAIKRNIAYHFVINPDVKFDNNIFDDLIQFAKQEKNIGMVMPQILNEDGSIQYLPKLLPTPVSIFLRKFKKPSFIYKPFINKYELRYVSPEVIYQAPILSGCFTLFNMEAIKEIGLYDDEFFMYFEDWDISRRMHENFKTFYYPKVSVIHGYESGENINHKLLLIRKGEINISNLALQLGYNLAVSLENGSVYKFGRNSIFDNGYRRWKLYKTDGRLFNSNPNLINEIN